MSLELTINNITNLLNKRSDAVDKTIINLWNDLFSEQQNISLIATGGYGRRELHPHSDIDLLLLLPENLQEDAQINLQIKTFIAKIWDAGYKVGHSVHSLNQCIKTIKKDLILFTSIMESRHLAGNKSSHLELLKTTNLENIWPIKKFFLAKWRELKKRYARYSDTTYNLEPNVKNSPGGLRDIQTIMWVIKRLQNTANLSANHIDNFLCTADSQQLERAQLFLWCVRFALHQISNKNEERLLFQFQIDVAQTLGIKADNPNELVQKLMHKYYQASAEVSVISEIVLIKFAQNFLKKSAKNPIKRLKISDFEPQHLINDLNSLQINGNYLEFIANTDLKTNPRLLLSLFIAATYLPKIKGISAQTIEQIRANLHLIDDEFRKNPDNCSLFLQLFKAKNAIHRNLRRMNRYGVLAAFLPEFAAIIGKAQHDLFHIYTVDAHTLNLIKHLRKLKWPELKEKYSLASELIEQITKPYILYLAGFLHDIGKIGKGSHSTIGAQIAQDFCLRHNIPADDADVIVWLVQNHLLMSNISRKKDVNDADVINDFAKQVKNIIRLDYLYLLTVADINATNPSLWNSWRASILRKLYINTKNLFIYQNTDQITTNVTEQALALINKDQQLKAQTLWQSLPTNYLQSLTIDELIWQTKCVLHDNNTNPMVKLRQIAPYQHEGATQIFIYMPDRSGLFATTTAVIASLNLHIQEAKIITSSTGFAWDTYLVLNDHGSNIADAELADITAALKNALQNHDDIQNIPNRRLSSTARYLAPKPKVQISNDLTGKFTTIEITAADRPNVVATIAKIFLQFNLRLHHAKINTLGLKIEDTFIISTAENKSLSEPIICNKLQQTIIKHLTI